MQVKRNDSVDILKVVLVSILILSGYFLPGTVGAYLAPVLCFAGSGFFFCYGYFILPKVEQDDSRLKLSIKRLFLAFAVSAVVYFGIEALVLVATGGSPLQLFTKRSIFNFLVLNIWSPNIGFNVFFLQAALYAACVCYLANKLKLMKFDTLVMVLLFLLAAVFGEGAGIINFKVLGYTYIPGNFLTRALPYMLLGRVMKRYMATASFRQLKSWVWIVLAIVGVMLVFLETVGLAYLQKAVYLNQLIGCIPMTVGVCMYALRDRRPHPIARYCNDMFNAMFYSYTVIGEFIYYILLVWLTGISFLVPYLGLVTLVVTMVIAWLYAYRRNRKKMDTEGKEEATNHETEVHV